QLVWRRYTQELAGGDHRQSKQGDQRCPRRSQVEGTICRCGQHTYIHDACRVRDIRGRRNREMGQGGEVRGHQSGLTRQSRFKYSITSRSAKSRMPGRAHLTQDTDDLARALGVINPTSTVLKGIQGSAVAHRFIVFTGGGDPVNAGLVASLHRPGGNVTGITGLNVEVAPKRLELLHELIPTATIVALLVNPTNPTLAGATTGEVQTAARILGCNSMSCTLAANGTSKPCSQRRSNCGRGAGNRR